MMLDAAAPIAKRTWSVYVRSEIFDKGVFLFMTEDGGSQIVKLQQQDAIDPDRRLLQGKDSMLPMKVKKSAAGGFLIMEPLDAYRANNTNFVGEEA